MSAKAKRDTSRRRLDWGPILEQAAAIVESYNTLVTLRQLFYRLVAAGLIPNRHQSYKYLSDRTAEAREAGEFPDLVDLTRAIERYRHFDSPQAAREWLARGYRRDRTEGQPWSVYLGVEKRGLVAQLQAWFGDLGVPILPVGGYSSQSFVDDVARDVFAYDRPAVLLYAGDFDPSGIDIVRDFVKRAGCFDKMIRVGLNIDQIADLPFNPYPETKKDSRRAQFIARFGDQLEAMGLPRLVQYEVDALAPDVLQALYREALEEFWDESLFEAVLDREEQERTTLGEAP